MKLALACLVVVGCSQGNSPRELACKRADEHAAATPRRYRDTAQADHLAELCGSRERDCAEVRSYFEHPLFDVVPDRERDTGIRDEGALQELQRRNFHDQAVANAVREVVLESGTAFYMPADNPEAPAVDERARAAYATLAKLCQLPPRG